MPKMPSALLRPRFVRGPAARVDANEYARKVTPAAKSLPILVQGAMLENGANIRFIQAMLGHAKLETTEIYTHVSIRQLKAIHESTHPARMHSVAASEIRAEIEEMMDEEEDLAAPDELS